MHWCQESKLLELHLPSTNHLNVAADDIFLLPSDNTFCAGGHQTRAGAGVGVS